MIEIRHLSKSYGRHAALQDIDLQLGNGQCTALTGPNGSGKTTLIKCLLQMVHPDRGTIRFNGQDIGHDESYRRSIGYMPQLSRFPEHMKVGQLFALIRSLRKDVNTYDTAMYEELGVEKFSHRPLGILSEGMKQRVSAALAFYFHPAVLILDEPTAGLDPQANETLKKKIAQSVDQNKLVLITSHILSDLDDIASHIVYLMDGRVWLDKSLQALKDQTNETRLHKIILHLLRNGQEVYAENNQINTL